MEENKPYIVSARKYRPANFHSVVGQKALTATLKNAVSTGRVAQAYLFCGPRGVGKTSCARIFAKTLNCLSLTPEGEACGECEACRAVDAGNSFNLLELDAASNNSVNDIRDIMDQVNVPPQNGRYRVFILDEVHMLSPSAFNAFLKTLEEPPRHVVFILATTEKHKILPTILSRCQVYDFKRITVDDMVEHLQYVASQEGITAEAEALDVIAQKADGAMRDALSIFDQVAASCMGNITYSGTVANLNVLDYDYYFRLVDSFEAGDVAGALLTYNEIRDKGFDSLFFVGGLASHLRNLMVAADPRTVGLLEVSKAVGTRYEEQAAKLPPHWYYQALGILNECDVNYRTAANKQLVVEFALVRLASLRNAALQQPAPQPVQPSKPQQPVQPAQPQSPAPERPAPVQPKPEGRPRPTPQLPPQTHRPVSVARKPGAPSSFRINGSNGTADGKPTADPDHRRTEASNGSRRETPITEERLSEAWQQFIISHPDHKIVIHTMQTNVPRPIGNGAYYIEVANPAQQGQFAQILTELSAFMRDRLGNDSFKLEVRLQEAESGQKMMTPREFISKAVQDNKVLSELLGFLDAELI